MDSILKNHKLLKLLLPVLVSPITSNTYNQNLKRQGLLTNKWFLRTIENTSTVLPEYYETDTCERNTYFEFMPKGILKLGIFGSDANGNCILTNTKKARYILDRFKNKIMIYSDHKEEIFKIEKLTGQTLIIAIDRTRKFHFQLNPNR